jgi:nucleotide-binding universal stress UspA family protein
MRITATVSPKVRQAAHEPYQRVLVPVDFSPWSFNSILLALQAAPGATLILMHAVQIPFEGKMRYAGVADTLIDRYLGEARREARQKLQELAARTGLPAGRIRLMAADGGAPWMLIAQQEQEYDCDLIVVGRQGRNAAEDLLLGSTARTVMAECSADVLVSTSSEP